MSPRPKDLSSFAFLKLPGEVRNQVYNELFEGHRVVWLERTRWACQHPTPTAILYTNRQIYAESSAVLYSHISAQLVVFYTGNTFKYNIFRIDEPNPKMKYLRNGRAMTVTPRTGNVFPHIIARMQDLEISLVWDFHDECTEPTYKCPGRTFNQYVRALLSSSICPTMSSASTANATRKTLTLTITDWNPDPLSFDQETRYEQRLFECLVLHQTIRILRRLCNTLGRMFQIKGWKITPELAKRIAEEYQW